jgi:hypothetical protein
MPAPGTYIPWTHERLALYITARTSDVNNDLSRREGDCARRTIV